MSGREPYETPEVASIDLGNLVDEVRAALEAAAARLDGVKGRAELMCVEVGALEADYVLAQAELEEAKKKLLKVQAAEELRGSP